MRTQISHREALSTLRNINDGFPANSSSRFLHLRVENIFGNGENVRLASLSQGDT
jgi:hypothetical protein